MAGESDKVSAGQDWEPPRAATWNALVDMLAEWRRFLHQQQQPAREAPIPTNCVKVKNNTGGQLRLGEVVELETTKLLTDVNRRMPWFNADVPDETRPFAICLEPIPDEKIGLAQIAGRCPALIDVQATTDLWAFVESGQDRLKGDRFWGDVRILYEPPGTGEQLLWVNIEASPHEWYGIADEEIVQDDTGAVSIFTGADFTTDTTHSIPACFNFAELTVESGARCVVKRISRKKVVEPLECAS